jgi:hypothetical protein
MRFWVRETFGWLLVLLGLFVFYTCYALLTNATLSRLIECGPLMFIGIFIFRGGIHLLKVAVAARVCLHAQALQREQEARSRTPGGVLRDPRMERLRAASMR